MSTPSLTHPDLEAVSGKRLRRALRWISAETRTGQHTLTCSAVEDVTSDCDSECQEFRRHLYGGESA
jgi:hypothetical protein